MSPSSRRRSKKNPFSPSRFARHSKQRIPTSNRNFRMLPPPPRPRRPQPPPPPQQQNLCPTSEMTFVPSNHGNLRRSQRRIGILELQSAVKHGSRRPGRILPNGDTTSIYEHKGVVYVVNDVTKREITSFASPINLRYRHLSRREMERHRMSVERVRRDMGEWTSHSILVVDVSGSMRNSDVKGERTRLGAVWISIAVDFVAQRIESQNGTDSDVVTIILMGESATILVEEMPTDWMLYNEILSIYWNGIVVPRGHGCFVPALDLAESLLRKNDYSSCALSLTVLSDGRPSDGTVFKDGKYKDVIKQRVENLASRLGRRLTVATVGMGSLKEFDTLQTMAEVAKDYGSMGMFQLPSMTCSGLGQALSSVATSLTESQIEMTSFKTKRQRTVRNVLRESRSTIPLLTEEVEEKGFRIFMEDQVHHMVYDPASPDKFRKAPLQHPSAAGVALKRKAFGEGQERFAYQFFEIESDTKTVVGPQFVAKESRFIEDWKDRDKFVHKFCTLQHQARETAVAFNEKLDQIKQLDESAPRVSFLDCSVYYVTIDGEECAVLVERMLNGEFRKWNSNNGNVFHDNLTTGETIRLQKRGYQDRDLYIIDEESPETTSDESIFVTPDDVAQAFSHFSYFYSGDKRLICDLQGVYDRQQSLFRFTDPVIHYYDNQKLDKVNVYGRTDRGRRGIDDFFQSHVCNCLCRFVTRGWKDVNVKRRRYEV